jgi:hypothetical protein
MKKSLVLGIIGAGAFATSMLGQGVQSGNYSGDSGAIGSPIVYANSGVPAGKAGLAVGSDFSGELYYFTGGNYVAIPSSITPFGSLPVVPDGDAGDVAGYQISANVQVPGWTSGSVSFEWAAFNNVTIGGDAPGTITGISAPFTITPVSSALPDYPDFAAGSGYAAFTVAAAVPEPTTLALLGLGAAGLMALRRRNA